MLDGNVLLRQKRDEVPEGTLSCPDRNLAVFHHYRHYEGLRLLPSVCDSKLIQQTLNNLALDGRKVPFLGAIATGPQLLYEGRAAVDPTHQVVDSDVALGVREKFVGEVVLADVVFLHDRCLISSLAI